MPSVTCIIEKSTNHSAFAIPLHERLVEMLEAFCRNHDDKSDNDPSYFGFAAIGFGAYDRIVLDVVNAYLRSRQQTQRMNNAKGNVSYEQLYYVSVV